MKILNYWHGFLGRNKNGYLNSYGNYLLKQKQVGDYVFNWWFAIFNIFYLLRWKMYAETIIVMIVNIELYWYYYEKLSPVYFSSNMDMVTYQTLVITMASITFSPIYLFSCFIVSKLLQLKLDYSVWKYKLDPIIIPKKVKRMNYLLIPFASSLFFVICFKGIGFLQQLILQL